MKYTLTETMDVPATTQTLVQILAQSNEGAGQVWQVEDSPSTFVDQTAGFNDATNANFTPFPTTEATADYVAIGFRQKFANVTFDNLNGTSGAGGVIVWEYWNGSTWASLSGVSDGTTGFTASVADDQVLTFTVPGDWARRALNTSADLFYIRARITTVYSTNPIYDQGFVNGKVVTPVDFPVYVRRWSVMLIGATPSGGPINFDWAIQTTAGTGTVRNAGAGALAVRYDNVERDSIDRSLATIATLHSAEPTLGKGGILAFSLHPQGKWDGRAPHDGFDIKVDGGTRMGLRYLSNKDSDIVKVRIHLELEE